MKSKHDEILKKNLRNVFFLTTKLFLGSLRAGRAIKNINIGVSVVFKAKYELKCQNELFLKYHFSGNTSFYDFITEIIWRNNWQSIIDVVERLGYRFTSNYTPIDVSLRNLSTWLIYQSGWLGTSVTSVVEFCGRESTGSRF